MRTVGCVAMMLAVMVLAGCTGAAEQGVELQAPSFVPSPSPAVTAASPADAVTPTPVPLLDDAAALPVITAANAERLTPLVEITPDMPITQIAFDTAGAQLALADPYAGVHVYPVTGGGEADLLPEDYNPEMVLDAIREQTLARGVLTFTADDAGLAVVGASGPAHVWDFAAGEASTLVFRQDRPGPDNDLLAVSADGRMLAMGEWRYIGDGYATSVHFWLLQEGASLPSLTGNLGLLRAMAFDPDGQHFAVAGADQLIHVAALESGLMLWEAEIASRSPTELAFSPDGAWVACGHRDGTVEVWNAADGAPVAAFASGDLWVMDLAFSPDGGLLAVVVPNGAVHVFDPAGGESVAVLPPAPLAYLAESVYVAPDAAFSPDGRLLAVARANVEEAVVQVWGVVEPVE